MKIGLLNIGNTNTELCPYDLSSLDILRTDELVENAHSFFADYTEVYVASVVPDVFSRLKCELKNIKFYELSLDKVKSVNFSKVDASTLGADRIANILGAAAFFKNVTVIDCGTCVTAEVIFDGDFLGGLIMPGRALQRKALNSFTGQLPEVGFQDKLSEIGKNTSEAILVGTDTIALSGLHAWIQKTVEGFHEMAVCFTGGDSAFYMQGAPFKYNEYSALTLEGLRIFASGKC